MSHSAFPNDLVGRRVEVFWDEEEEWFPGVVVEAQHKGPDRTNVSGYTVKYDDGDEGVVETLRGNPRVRFLVRAEGESRLGGHENSWLTDSVESHGGSQDKQHFLSNTFSSTLPEYSNFDAERIGDAFRPQNFLTLSKLPSTFKPDAVTLRRRACVKENLLQDVKPKPEHTSLAKLGLFSRFEYVPTKYSREEELQRQERMKNSIKMHAISSQTFMPASSDKRLKHEDQFNNKDFSYPYMHSALDTKDRIHQAHTSAEPSPAYGVFKPTGRSATDSIPTRKLLPDIMKQIHAILVKDWPRANFSVLVDERDYIILRFEISTIDSGKGLSGYMNTITRDHSNALPGSQWYNRYRLKKVLERWGRSDDSGFVYFTFKPPWVFAHPQRTAALLMNEKRTTKPQGSGDDAA